MAAQNQIEVMDLKSQAVAATHAVTPMDMLDRALAQGAGIDVLEKLMNLQERFEKNQARKAFDQAISDAKADIPPIIKNSETDFTSKRTGERTNYQYETLDGIAKVIDPILSKCGLSYRFRSQQHGDRLSVTCIVAHRDGYSEETTLSGPPDMSGSKNAYQAVGSAATYLQRYTLKLALGLSAARDDDAQSAGSWQPDQDPRQRQPEQRRQNTKGVSKDTEARAVFMLHQESVRQSEGRDDLKDAWNKALSDKDRIPPDWWKRLVSEKDAKVQEIFDAEKAEADKAEAERQFDQTDPSGDDVIDPNAFLDLLDEEMGSKSDPEEVYAVWNARTPEDVLEFPGDFEIAEKIRDRHLRRVGA